MKNLNELKKEIANCGFAEGEHGQASKDLFERLEWIKVVRITDAGYGINRYHCSSNIGSLHIYFEKTGVGISSVHRDNNEFVLSEIVKQVMPPYLIELVEKAESEGEFLLLVDAKKYIQYFRLKSEQEYYEWWDKAQPKFLPRNPDEYYSRSGN
jgi:hypothetical protein